MTSPPRTRAAEAAGGFHRRVRDPELVPSTSQDVRRVATVQPRVPRVRLPENTPFPLSPFRRTSPRMRTGSTSGTLRVRPGTSLASNQASGVLPGPSSGRIRSHTESGERPPKSARTNSERPKSSPKKNRLSTKYEEEDPEVCCPICFERMLPAVSSRSISCTPCGHLFCSKCIECWVSLQSVKCPICRKIIGQKGECLKELLVLKIV